MAKMPRLLVFLFFVFAWGSLILLLGCGGTRTDIPTAPHQVLTISDLHFNPFYDPSLFPALVAADASQWKEIFQRSKIKKPSKFGTDTNYPLLVLALASMKQNLGSSPVVLFTGDVLGHGIPQIFCAIYNHAPVENCPPLDAAGAVAMQQFVDKTMAFVALQIRASVGNVPVFIVPGNIDTYSGGAGPDTDFLANNAGTIYTQFLLRSVDQATFQSSFTTLGSYSAQAMGSQLLVVAMNSNPLAEGAPLNPDDELTWLQSQLASARASGQKVWLLMHVPPGVNTMGTAQNAAQAGTPSQVTDGETSMMWEDNYLERFLQILGKYPTVVTMMLGGHTHMDEYRIMSTGNILYGIPGITPWFGNNPAFKIFTVTQSSFMPTDYLSIDYDLSAQPSQFRSLYRFSTAYGVSPNASLQYSSQQLSTQFAHSSAKRSAYIAYYDSGNTSLNPKTNVQWNPVNNGNWPIFACGISQAKKQKYVPCVNTY